jgi:hypothetical protein
VAHKVEETLRYVLCGNSCFPFQIRLIIVTDYWVMKI